MKKVILCFVAIIFCFGCASTKTTIYGKNGKIEKVIESNSNAVFEGVLNLRDKIVIVVNDKIDIGIYATIDAETPIPHGKIKYESGLTSVITIPKGITADIVKELPAIISAPRGKTKVNFEGLTSE